MTLPLPLPHSDDLARHARAIRAFSAALCRQDSDAGDVAQSTMALALEKHEGVRGSLGGWLCGAARFVAREKYRSDARRTLYEAAAARSEAIPSAEERAARLEMEERLIAWVRELPTEQSEAVYLRFWEDLAPREIAERVGVPVGTVKTRLKRGLARLRSQLSADTPGGKARWMGILGAAPAAQVHVGSAGAAAGAWAGSILMNKAMAAVAATLVAWGTWSLLAEPTQSDGPMTVPSTESAESAPAALAMGAPPEDGKREAVDTVDVSPPLSPSVSTRETRTGRVILGQVLNVASHSEEAQGTPAAGANVRLNWGWSMGPDAATAVTDGSGRFRMEVPELPSADLVVAVDGDESFRHADARIDFPTDETGERSCVITRYLNGGLKGTITDLGLQPIEGVLVTASPGGADSPQPVMEARSGADGVFHFPRFTADCSLDFAAKGWTLVSRAVPHQASTGAWGEIDVVLSRHGSITVQIVDDAGTPVPGVDVLVSRSRAETSAGRTSGGGQRQTASVRSKTDADGAATLENVWAKQKLTVRAYRGRQDWSWERQGAACPYPGASIVLRDGDTSALIFRIGSARRINGRVCDPEGSSVPGASVWLRSYADDRTDPARLSIAVDADEDGRFQIEYFAHAEMGPGHLLATDAEPWQLEQGVVKSPGIASREMDLQQSADGILLQLLPTHEIRGTVTGPDRNPIRAWVEVTEATPSPAPGRLRNGVGNRAIANKTGTFRIGGLPEGRYTVSVSHAEFSGRIVPDVRAGTTDLSVTLEGAPDCTLHVEVVAPPGVLMKKTFLQTAALRRDGPGSISSSDLPARATYAAPGGYGDPASGFNGYHGRQSAAGLVESMTLPIEGPRATRSVRSGPGWVGVMAITESGERLYPVGTGLVELTKGEHHLRFELRRTGSISGVIKDTPATSDPLFLALALPTGELLEFMDRGAPYTTAELGARGDFRFDRLPTGDFELLIGTTSALARRTHLARLPIQIESGENEPIVIEAVTRR